MQSRDLSLVYKEELEVSNQVSRYGRWVRPAEDGVTSTFFLFNTHKS